MVILTTVLTINLAGQRVPRSLAIGENQLVTNIRLAQSDALSAQSLPNGQSVQFYVIKFSYSNPSQYTIQAIYNNSQGLPFVQDLQTITLPAGIVIASSTFSSFPIVVNRSSSPNFQPMESGCALVAFAAPFGKILFNDGCTVSNFNSTGGINTNDPNDDYAKIVNFIANTDCAIGPYGYPESTSPACTISTDSNFSLTLTDSLKTLFKAININSVTQSVVFN